MLYVEQSVSYLQRSVQVLRYVSSESTFLMFANSPRQYIINHVEISTLNTPENIVHYFLDNVNQALEPR